MTRAGRGRHPHLEDGPQRMAYGDYILRTGLGVIGRFELVMGRYYYEKDFAGVAPVLDLGPGRCWFMKQAPEDIIGVDLSPEVVAHYRNEGLRIHEGSAYEIPFPDGTFAGAFSCWLWEHIPDLDRAMQELYRVMAPGAKALIIVPSARHPNFWDDYTHVRPFTDASLQQLASNNGFEDVSTCPMPFMRGIMQLMRATGDGAAWTYLNTSDRVLRRLGLANRGNLELRCRKPAAGRS